MTSLFQLPVQVETETVTSPGVTIYTPRLSGLQSPAVQKKLNAAFSGLTASLVNEQNKYQTGTLREMTGHYEVKTNQRGLLSLIATNYAYSAPMAHGYTVAESLTCDVNSGNFFTLSQLFKSGSGYVELLSQHVRVQLQRRKLPLLNPPFKSVWPDQNFYLADKALVVYFDLLEITPYYVGFPMFPISVYDLLPIAAERGPLDILAVDVS
ncbi:MULTISPECIES: DUF3298 and DUF4163 domain-containing protein [unclassified Paenibacillus]|uniref:DUF3298 and DUF4163 domain-containing protein n=1 Tax=unclassified Paenibacillus TaxID=185978 RepID=UPI00020D72CA|nr:MULTISPECIES: DUF3298 and DUF4163 domain-containing protein [unclassified Paenibacillus]EGL15741.1 hypothetical protein HMPREF9413_5150 [Paenibacillus sp. HGF7]EPD88230.1 hypothetical protein HMPREF1207_02404 [Paenibacillus sp. HGH0039]